MTSEAWIAYVIIGVCVGSGLTAISIIIGVIVVKCRRSHNKPHQRTQDRANNDSCCDNAAAGSFELDEDDRYYCSIPAAESNNNATNEYCRPLPAKPGDNDPKEYSALGPPEPSNNNNSPYYLSLKTDDTC